MKPFCESYKYLGVYLHRNFQLGLYINCIEGRVLSLMRSMAKFRNLKRLRLNINMFKVMVMSLISMGLLTSFEKHVSSAMSIRE